MKFPGTTIRPVDYHLEFSFKIYESDWFQVNEIGCKLGYIYSYISVIHLGYDFLNQYTAYQLHDLIKKSV